MVTRHVAMLPSVFRRKTLLPYYHRRLLLLFSSSTDSAAGATAASSQPPSMVEYLVSSCKLSFAEAATTSKSLAHLKSTEKPDAVLEFMRSQGFEDSHLQTLVRSYPKCLCWTVKILAPKFQSLRSLGYSESDLIDLIVSKPQIATFSVEAILPKLELWESLFGSRELLLKHFKRRTWFFTSSVEATVLPNLKFLREECGISEERVSRVVRNNPRFVVQKLDSLRALVGRAEELGIPRTSPMFLWTLHVLHTISKERFEAKHNLMISLGWSESEFSSAVRKVPGFLCISPRELRKRFDFLVKEVGHTPSCIASSPLLLLYSLEKRVIPRFRVMNMLKLKGLLNANWKLITVVVLTDAKFMKRFVLPYKEKAPELIDLL